MFGITWQKIEPYKGEKMFWSTLFILFSAYFCCLGLAMFTDFREKCWERALGLLGTFCFFPVVYIYVRTIIIAVETVK